MRKQLAYAQHQERVDIKRRRYMDRANAWYRSSNSRAIASTRATSDKENDHVTLHLRERRRYAEVVLN